MGTRKGLRMGWFLRKYGECKRVTAENAEALAQIMDQGDQRQADIARNFLNLPELEFYRLVGPENTEGRYVVGYVRLTGGQDFPEHYHEDVYATIFFTEGKGHAKIDEELVSVEAGDVAFLPPGTWHVIIADEGPLAYVVCASPDLGQDGKPNITFR